MSPEGHNDTALALVRGAFSESAVAAERQLAVIGKEHGDEALALVSRELSPAEVFALAKDGDATKSSVAQAFVTPDQLREAFSFFGSRYFGATTDVSRDLIDFLHPFFFEGTVERRHEMIAGFLKHPLSMRALCALCVGTPGFIEFFSKERQSGAEGWQELVLLVRDVNPEAYARIRKRVLEMTVRGHDDLAAAEKYVQSVAESLIGEARRVTGHDSGGDKPSEVFVGI